LSCSRSFSSSVRVAFETLTVVVEVMPESGTGMPVAWHKVSDTPGHLGFPTNRPTQVHTDRCRERSKLYCLGFGFHRTRHIL
jgi:hypothetical protein